MHTHTHTNTHTHKHVPHCPNSTDILPKRHPYIQVRLPTKDIVSLPVQDLRRPWWMMMMCMCCACGWSVTKNGTRLRRSTSETSSQLTVNVNQSMNEWDDARNKNQQSVSTQGSDSRWIPKSLLWLLLLNAQQRETRKGRRKRRKETQNRYPVFYQYMTSKASCRSSRNPVTRRASRCWFSIVPREQRSG